MFGNDNSIINILYRESLSTSIGFLEYETHVL